MVHKLTTSMFMLTVAVLLLQSCTSLGPKTAENILGSWQTSVGSFPMVVTYGTGTVQAGTNTPVAYGLSGDQLTYADGGQQVRVVSFISKDEMIQVDPVTGTEHRFSRLTQPSPSTE